MHEIALSVLLVSLLSAALFLRVVAITATQYRKALNGAVRAHDNAEHGLVVATALFILASAGVLSSIWFFIEPDFDDLQPMIIVAILAERGALLGLSLYLSVRHPEVGDD